MRARSLLVGLGKAAAVLVILAWSLVPIAFMVASSLKPGQDIFAVPPRFVFTPTAEHYEALATKWGGFFNGLLNSGIVTLGATVLVVVASTMAGFAYSRYRSPLTSGSASFVVAIRLLPPIVITLPLFPIVNRIGLNDTHLILILLYATFYVSLGSILMRAFIDRIPRELDEAAMIDGASRLHILVRIVAPLSAHGAAALAVFVVVYAWNEFLFAFVFTSTRAKTAPLFISEMLGSFDGVDWGVLFAASSVQLVPILVFVVLMQRYLVSGLSAGATKG